MIIYLCIPVLTFLLGFLAHWRFARKQRLELKQYRHSAMADYLYTPGQRR
jgi:hypothetical protein